MTHHAIAWFEIPVQDFARAKAFYSAIFDYEMPEMQFGPLTMGFLLHDRERGGIGGAIVKGVPYGPSQNGVRVYLAAGRDLSVVLDRVEGAGGRVTVPKFAIGGSMGHAAAFVDSEGNEICLNSPE